MAEKVIIDTDAGVDDAMAILLALNSPELEIAAFTTVHGNSELRFCTDNVLRILELANHGAIPVAVGAAAPLIRKATYGKFVHGDDGFGNTDLPSPSIKASEEHAVDLIIREVNEHPGEFTLVALGPLTNIALAIAKERSIVDKIKRVVFMGGTFMTPGNATPVSSANLFHDPHAARIVYDSGVDIISVGLDACRNFVFPKREIDEFPKKGSAGALIHQISSGVYLSYYSQYLGFPGYQSNDTPSIGYLIAPGLFTTIKRHVDIELSGEFTTAQTVVDYRERSGMPSNTEICIDLDGEKLKEIFMERVLK